MLTQFQVCPFWIVNPYCRCLLRQICVSSTFIVQLRNDCHLWKRIRSWYCFVELELKRVNFLCFIKENIVCFFQANTSKYVFKFLYVGGFCRVFQNQLAARVTHFADLHPSLTTHLQTELC